MVMKMTLQIYIVEIVPTHYKIQTPIMELKEKEIPVGILGLVKK